MKIIVLFCLTLHGILSQETSQQTQPSQETQSTDQQDGKLTYEAPGFITGLTGSILTDTSDTEELKELEYRFLVKRDSINWGDKIKFFKDKVTGIFFDIADTCKRDFSSNPFFAEKHIQLAQQAGSIEQKPIEITLYRLDSPVVSQKVHKCSCTITGSANEDSNSICINGYVYLTEAVNGDNSYFVMKKGDNYNNLVLKAQITLNSTPQPEEGTPQQDANSSAQPNQSNGN